MALLLKKAYQGYHWILVDQRDPRSDPYYLVPTIWPVFFIGLSYLYFVIKWGPEFMKNRKPFKLERIIILYNLIQVLVNVYMVASGWSAFFKNVNLYCNEVDYSDSPDAMLLHRLCYVYYITKIMDLLDTVFFILRKKDNQVTFLHVYHHYGMLYIAWGGVKYLGGGQSIILGFVNSIVHAVMYSYYLLTAWDAKYKKSIWWKKHITQLQLLQFFVLLISFGSLLFQPNCKYPKFASYFFVPQNIFICCLFGDFYWKTYIKPKSKPVQNNEVKKET